MKIIHSILGNSLANQYLVNSWTGEEDKIGKRNFCVSGWMRRKKIGTKMRTSHSGGSHKSVREFQQVLGDKDLNELSDLQ